MVRIFTVACPRCNKEFEVHFAELRNKDVKLHCPFCDHRFNQEESPNIDDRW